MSTIKVQDMSFSYAGSERLILKDINMEVKAGEFVCILGQSGCGKSTFLRLLAGLEKPTEGKLLIDEKEIKGASLDKGVVFQDYGLFPWMKSGENIMLALRQRFPQRDKKELKEIAMEMLEAVGLDSSVYNKFPKELSGGMKQRYKSFKKLSTFSAVTAEPRSLNSLITEVAQSKILTLTLKLPSTGSSL